jgi:hypothetical protein
VLLALAAMAIVVLALLWEVARAPLTQMISRYRASARRVIEVSYDPGRERRAEQRARALLRSCVGREEWEMYRDLGFLRVWGTLSGQGQPTEDSRSSACYAYLIYPHKPIVAYVPDTATLLNEYCVQFPDHSRPYGSARLPDSDDVLAKWMAIIGDEKRLIEDANMHLPGRQVDPDQARRDLARLARWESQRLGRAA